MPNSVFLDLPSPIAFVCYDAGAANLIFAWMRAEANKQPDTIINWRLLVQGPAKKLWIEDGLSQVQLCQTIDELLNETQVLVAGTGWASNLEYDSIQCARERGVRSIAVIDHWTNYRARFIRNEIEILPDEIWVTDDYAIKLSEREFEDINIIHMPNVYLENIVQNIRSHENLNKDGTNLLYLLEPIREAWGSDIINGEFEALDYFVQNLVSLGMNKNPSIRLRLHPSEPTDKYNHWINKHKHLNISLDENTSLAKSIAWSEIVVGCQTYAMVVALAADKSVFSSIPLWAPSCILPHEGIIKISELAKKNVSTTETNK
jgi:hypothetical protein